MAKSKHDRAAQYAPELYESLQNCLPLIIYAEASGAFKDCALPLGARKAISRANAILKRAEASCGN